MSQANNTISSRVTLLILQLLVVFVISFNVSLIDLARDYKVLGTGLIVFSVLTLCLPNSMWDGRWSITLPTLANGLLLLAATLQVRTIPPWLYLCYVLLMLMAAQSRSVMQTVGLSSILCALYGLPLYLLDLLQSAHVLALPTMAAIALVSVTKTRLINAEGQENTALEEKVRFEAMCDQLTGLPNRAQFIERVWRAVECGKNNNSFLFAILFIDLDGFKPINDQLGHKAGDAVLKAVAKRLHGCLRKGDIVGRYGGDEFTLLINNVSGQLDAIRVAERVLRKLQDPIDVGRSVRVGASIGIALSTNIHARPEDLIRDADAAMYRAKAKGKNCYDISDQLRDVVA
jgi:diguanylate cyclase (GGDEF)-like protein